MKWLEKCSPGDARRYALIEAALKNHPDLLKWLFCEDKPEMIYGASDILNRARGFSSGEKTLIKFACDIWFDTEFCPVSSLLKLDDDNYRNVVSALLLLRNYDHS